MFPTVSISISLNDLTNISSWTKKNNSTSLGFNSSKSKIILKKFHFPKHLTRESSNKIICGYKLDTHNFEITIATNFLSIATPTMGEIQLFYYFFQNHFFASDSFAHLIKLIPQKLLPALDPEGIVNFLSLDFKLDERTIFSDIKLLRENSKLEINNSKLKTSILKDWKEMVVLGSSTYTLGSAAKLFEKRLAESLDNILNNYQGKVASTLSGGIDSSLISAALINKQGKNTPLYTIAFTEPDRTYQEKRINDFMGKFGGKLNIIDISKTMLLPKTKNLYVLDPYIDPYIMNISKLAKKSYENKDFIVMNGHGGDHLFNQLIKKTICHHEENITNFFSTESQQIILKKSKNKEEITSIISKSISKTLFSNYPCWRSVGVWPHAPLINPSIISLAHLLPNKFCQKKIIIAEYMKKNNFPSSTFNSKNPNYNSFFHREISKIPRNLLIELSNHSLLGEIGIINPLYIKQYLLSKEMNNKQKRHLHGLLYVTIRLEFFLKNIFKQDNYA